MPTTELIQGTQRDVADGEAASSRLDRGQVWRALAKASFAVIAYVTPTGKPRSSGVVYAMENGHLYTSVAPDSWKARTIADGTQVSVTVPVRRGGLLSLLVPIPPATISFHARAIVHPAGTLDNGILSKKLAALLPENRRAGSLIELVPEGSFLTYGVGVSLMAMMNPDVALARVPS
jgi:hypothetical protein